jgi:Ca2+/Na+ antiporter
MVKIKLRILVAYFSLFHVPHYCERELLFSLIIIPIRLFISHFHSVKVIHSIQILYTFVLILYMHKIKVTKS